MSPSRCFSLISVSSSIFYLLISSPSVSSETINCNGACGPCTSFGELCNLKCLQYESCKDSRLTCYNEQSDYCTIDCSADKGCLSARIQAQTASELTVNCFMNGACEGMVVYGGQDSNIYINCDADNSCADMVIHGYNADNVYISCVGQTSCEGLQVECGSGDCILACLNNVGGVCGGVKLGCGTSPKCQINCSGNNKCETMTVNVASAIGFECIGTATECAGAPPPFMLPTKSPTSAPTLPPTKAPTAPPTNNPSPAPTLPPSPAPTSSPSPAPTDSPTSNPTPAPTTNPTKVPSPAPTIYPTPTPTNNPTKMPSKSPSKSPTKSPTKDTKEPTVSPTDEPTHEPTPEPTESTAAPTYDPTNDPTTPSPTIRPTGGETQNANPLANLSTNESVAYLILVCIIMGSLCCCCIPIIIIIYLKYFKHRFDDKKRLQEELDKDDVAHIDDKGVPFGDIEGDYSHYQHGQGRGRGRKKRKNKHNEYSLSQVYSQSTTAKDGYSAHNAPFGSSNNFRSNMTVPPTFTNGAPRQQQTVLNPLVEADSLNTPQNQGGFIQDADMTKDIIRVTIFFIDKVQLPQYCELFILNGYTNLDLIKNIKNMHQLEILGIERSDHRFQIMAAINVLSGRGMYEDSDSDFDFHDDSYLEQDGSSRQTGGTRRRNKRYRQNVGNKGNKRRGYQYNDVELEYCDKNEVDGQRETRYSGVANAEFAGRGRGGNTPYGDDADEADDFIPGPADTLGVWQIDDMMEQDLTMQRKPKNKQKVTKTRGGDEREKQRRIPKNENRTNRGQRSDERQHLRAKVRNEDEVRMRSRSPQNGKNKGRNLRAKGRGNQQRGGNKGRGNYQRAPVRSNKVELMPSHDPRLSNGFSEGNDGISRVAANALDILHDSDSSELMMDMLDVAAPANSLSTDPSVAQFRRGRVQ